MSTITIEPERAKCQSLVGRVSMYFKQGKTVYEIADELKMTVTQVRELDILNQERRLEK